MDIIFQDKEYLKRLSRSSEFYIRVFYSLLLFSVGLKLYKYYRVITLPKTISYAVPKLNRLYLVSVTNRYSVNKTKYYKMNKFFVEILSRVGISTCSACPHLYVGETNASH